MYSKSTSIHGAMITKLIQGVCDSVLWCCLVWLVKSEPVCTQIRGSSELMPNNLDEWWQNLTRFITFGFELLCHQCTLRWQCSIMSQISLFELRRSVTLKLLVECMILKSSFKTLLVLYLYSEILQRYVSLVISDKQSRKKISVMEIFQKLFKFLFQLQREAF